MSDGRALAVEELTSLLTFCREEAAAEHNAEDARTAFAIVRNRCIERIEALQQAGRDEFYDELDD